MLSDFKCVWGLLISAGINLVSNFKEICLARMELMLADGRT